MRTQFRKFLATFDPTQPRSATNPDGFVSPPPAPAPPAAEPTVPMGVVLSMAEAIARRDAAANAWNAARNAPPAQPAPVVAAPAPPAAPTIVDNSAELEALKRSVNTLTHTLERQGLETYRLQAINIARTNGNEFSDLMVGGRNQAEIDLSIQAAIAEYKYLETKWLEKHPPPVVQPPAPVVPQGTVQAAAVPPQGQQPVQGQPPGTVSVPSMIAAPGPPLESQVITAEQLAYLTSPEAIRNGDYAANRHLLQNALRAGLSGPGQHWSFSGGPQPGLNPPGTPPGMPVGGPGPVGRSHYAGLTQPDFSNRSFQGQPPNGGPPARGVPTTGFGAGRAPQPAHFQLGNPETGYAPNGAPDANAQAAAVAAAQASTQAARARAGMQ